MKKIQGLFKEKWNSRTLQDCANPERILLQHAWFTWAMAMRAWLAETIYWITFIVIKQITFPHFWITFGGKSIFLLFLLLCHKILQELKREWSSSFSLEELYSLVYLYILFIPTAHQKLTLNRVWKGIFGIRELTKIRCGIREKAGHLNGKRDFTATREARVAKI